MTTATPPPPDGDPGDDAFEAFLSTANDQLLEYVRSHTDPTRALSALLEVVDEPNSTPEYPYTTSPGQATEKAIQRVASRFAVQDLIARLTHARDLARQLDDTLARTRLDGALTRELADRLVAIRELVQDLGAGLAPAPEVDRRLDRLFRNLDRICASLPHLNLDSSRLDALTFLGKLDLGRDLDIAMGIKDGLMESPVDVSGVDLTRAEAVTSALPAQAIQALDGVVWDDSTRWPDGLKTIIEERSEPIGEGRYRVRAGTERDSYAR
ncbi:hypothetical protein [Actinomadura sp. 7K534]|uniref:hypothetical protein n=1 Tax=Actinomadura sp. 7K534 TaxID=2530366 RepID=UPI001045BDD4|nr:hypothetical protein [Actinomadura sp. 7K534]TDB84299.1 hypothetical protein E1266_36865 [Actinomadura sp. 7K534]